MLEEEEEDQPALQPLLCSGLLQWQLLLPLAGQACLTSDLSRCLFLHLYFNLKKQNKTGNVKLPSSSGSRRVLRLTSGGGWNRSAVGGATLAKSADSGDAEAAAFFWNKLPDT